MGGDDQTPTRMRPKKGNTEINGLGWHEARIVSILRHRRGDHRCTRGRGSWEGAET